MHQQLLKRVLFLYTRPLAWLVLFLLVLGSLFALIVMRSDPAVAAPNNTLNFQARLQNGAGAVVSDGYYNIEFKLYDNLSTPGAGLWTETYTGANRVRVANGYLSVSLGSVTANPGTVGTLYGLFSKFIALPSTLSTCGPEPPNHQLEP